MKRVRAIEIVASPSRPFRRRTPKICRNGAVLVLLYVAFFCGNKDVLSSLPEVYYSHQAESLFYD